LQLKNIGYFPRGYAAFRANYAQQGKISEQYIEEVEYKTSTLSSMMEPLIIIFLGIIVGVILIAMYLPLFQMSNSFQ
jgi:hypothetical protein